MLILLILKPGIFVFFLNLKESNYAAYLLFEQYILDFKAFTENVPDVQHSSFVLACKIEVRSITKSSQKEARSTSQKTIYSNY